MKFVRVEQHHRLPDLPVQQRLKTLRVVANEQPPHRRAGAVRLRTHHRQHIHNRQLLQKLFRRVIQHPPHRRVRAAHHALHPVHRAQVMAAVDACGPARAYQNVLVAVRHAHHLVRHHLADRDDQVERRAVAGSLHQQAVHLRRPRKIQLPLRLLPDHAPWHLAQRHNVLAPAMRPEQPRRHPAEHSPERFRVHRRVRTQRRHHRQQTVAEQLIRHRGQLTRARMDPRGVRRQRQHPPAVAQLPKSAPQRFPKRRRAKLSGSRSFAEVNSHKSPLPADKAGMREADVFTAAAFVALALMSAPRASPRRSALRRCHPERSEGSALRALRSRNFRYAAAIRRTRSSCSERLSAPMVNAWSASLPRA